MSHSDLRLGDRVTVLAFQNPSEQSSQQLQLSEGARVGILLNMNRLEIVKTLVDADQDLNSDEFGLVLKRKYYQHDGRFEVKFGGVIPMVEGDSIGIGAYRIDLNQPLSQLASIDYDQVIALYRGTFNPGQTYDVPIFPALIPGIVNESRKISGLAIIGWKDMNKDGKVDHFEPVGIYSDALLGGTPTLVTLALTLNQLPGAIMMGGSAQTPAAAGSILRGH